MHTKISTKNQQSLIILIFIIGILGVFFRTQGFFFDPQSFHVDEANIAKYLSPEGGIKQTVERFGSSRPVGYLIISKILLNIKNNEISARILSLVPSILSIPLFFILVRYFFKNSISVVLAYSAFCLNPFNITFAKVFKHYPLEAAIHITAITLTLFVVKDLERRKLLLLLTFLAFCPFFCGANFIFLYPGIFLLLILKFKKDFRAKVYILATAFLNFFIIGMVYILFWRPSMSRFISTWDQKYAGFIPENENFFAWSLKQTSILFEYFFNYPLVPQFQYLGEVLLVMAIISVIVMLVRKDTLAGLLLFTPVATAYTFNYLGYWPLGTDRTNLFLIPYMVALCFYSLGQIQWESTIKIISKARLVAAIPIIYLMLPPSLNYYYRTSVKYNNPHEDFKSALKHFISAPYQPSKQYLYLNPHAMIAFEYYTNYHDHFSKYSDRLHKRFNIQKYSSRERDYVIDKTKDILQEHEGQDVYFLLYHYRETFLRAINRWSTNYKHQYPRSVAIRARYRVPTIFSVGEKIKLRMETPSSDFSSSQVQASRVPLLMQTYLFQIKVDKHGFYTARAKVLAKDGTSNSWYISLNDGEKKAWHFTTSPHWNWQDLSDSWELEKGVYVITLVPREPTPLDQISIIPAKNR